MSEFALPCLICDKRLRNAVSDSTNQPDEGTAFDTQGHYGSTVFDPMDGTFIEISICDECLVKKGREGKVLWNKRYLNITCDGVIVGRQWVHRPQVDWNPDVVERDIGSDNIEIDIEDVGTDKLGTTTIEWGSQWREAVEAIKKHRAFKEQE